MGLPGGVSQQNKQVFAFILLGVLCLDFYMKFKPLELILYA